MARRVSISALESRSARLRLKIRRRPYSGPSLARGISLMYRRNKTNGTWVLKASDGYGAYWTKGIALADDFEDADSKNVLTFHQAQDAAKKLARGEDGGMESAPATLDSALKAYEADLTARQANVYNAKWPRLHLTAALLAKPVALLDASEKMAQQPAQPDRAFHRQPAVRLRMRGTGIGGAARPDTHQEPACLGSRSCPTAGCAAGAQRYLAGFQGARIRR